MDTTTLVILGVLILAVIITLLLLAQLLKVDSRFVTVPDQGISPADKAVPSLPAERLHPLAVNWLVEGYCVKDRKRVEMMNPYPIVLKNGKPATVGVCPLCATTIYKIGNLTAVARAPEDRERIQQGRRELA